MWRQQSRVCDADDAPGQRSNSSTSSKVEWIAVHVVDQEEPQEGGPSAGLAAKGTAGNGRGGSRSQ
jgi:hypothetical protein